MNSNNLRQFSVFFCCPSSFVDFLFGGHTCIHWFDFSRH
uniref:Uncharacterized protein n=1 Tax=Rhizophora mucronata TaxID=61149 RepID=A0A2P2QST8_RHIMU